MGGERGGIFEGIILIIKTPSWQINSISSKYISECIHTITKCSPLFTKCPYPHFWLTHPISSNSFAAICVHLLLFNTASVKFECFLVELNFLKISRNAPIVWKSIFFIQFNYRQYIWRCCLPYIYHGHGPVCVQSDAV